MARGIMVGNASGKRGQYAYGTLATLPLPSGGVESWPVIVAQGDDGPVLWLTANIHGGEVTGLAAIQEALTPDLPRRLRGTLVVVPTLNPAGLRIGARRPYYDDHDPNRLFPQRKGLPSHEERDEDDLYPSPYTVVAHEIGAAMRATADYLVDLHCAWSLSLPFTIRDRVLYRDERERPQAEALGRTLDAMARACGLAVVNEYPRANMSSKSCTAPWPASPSTTWASRRSRLSSAPPGSSTPSLCRPGDRASKTC